MKTSLKQRILDEMVVKNHKFTDKDFYKLKADVEYLKRKIKR